VNFISNFYPITDISIFRYLSIFTEDDVSKENRIEEYEEIKISFEGINTYKPKNSSFNVKLD